MIIGQLGITISQPLKATFFLMFLFAVGYGVGPQFVRGIAKDGVPQALFAAVVMRVLPARACVVIAKIAGYDLGYAAGLYSGSQTISASMGLSTDAINRLGLPPDQTKRLLDAMPVAYAVTYIFGTVGSAIVLALLGPALLGIDLEAACKRYEEEHGGTKELGGAGTAWHRFELRAFRVRDGREGRRQDAQEAEALVPGPARLRQRIRRDGKIMEATADTVIQAATSWPSPAAREVLVELIGPRAKEVDDRELARRAGRGRRRLVTSKAADGKTLAELATMPEARGVFLRKITRGATATDIPILPATQINRGDILTLVGRTQDTTAATKALGVADRPTDVADVAFIGACDRHRRADRRARLQGRRRAAHAVDLRRRADLRIFFGWLRSVRPTFGRIPSPTVWFMNSVGLNMFIAVVGISSGPGFVDGLKQLGFGLFLWGVAVTTVPLILAHVCRKVRLPLPRRAFCSACCSRRPHDDGLARHDQRSRQKPDPGTRLYGHLRGRQHAADDLGNGAGDPDDVRGIQRGLYRRGAAQKSRTCNLPDDRHRLPDRPHQVPKLQPRHRRRVPAGRRSDRPARHQGAALVKTIFFDLFLFTTGYKVGPQFFRGLKGDAVPQVALTVLLCVTCLLTAFGFSKLLGYDVGTAAGLLAGAFSESTVIGTAGEAIQRLALPEAEKAALINNIPVAYAVTYLIGTAALVWFLPTIGPKLMGVNLRRRRSDAVADRGRRGDIRKESRPPHARSMFAPIGSPTLISSTRR